MSLYICAVSLELSMLINEQYAVYATNEGSDESVHMCSLAKAFSAHQRTVCGIVTSDSSYKYVHICSFTSVSSAHLQKV